MCKAMSESVQKFLNHMVSQGIIPNNKGSTQDDDSPEEDIVILSLSWAAQFQVSFYPFFLPVT